MWEETPSKRCRPETDATSRSFFVQRNLFQEELQPAIGDGNFNLADFNILDIDNDDNLELTELQSYLNEDSIHALCESPPPSVANVSNEPDEPQPVETTVPIEDSVREKGGKKKYFCIFCKNLVTNFPRHLMNNHTHEEEVKELLSLEANSQGRKNLLKILRGKGTIFFNTSENLNKGAMIVSRVKKNTDSSLYKPCPNCNNYFSKVTLYKHYRKCKEGSIEDMRQLQTSSSAVMIQPILDGKANNTMATVILPGMINDDVYDMIKKDTLIIEYGNYLCTKLKLNKTHLKNSIRTRLRQIGSLLKKMIDIQPAIQRLQDAFQPHHFDTFIEAVRKSAGYCSDSGTFRAPSLVTQIGNNMRMCAERLNVYCIKTENDELKRKTRKWLELYGHEYNNVVGKPALEDAAAKKWNKPRLLPTTEDVMKLNKYIKTCADKAENKLRNKFDQSSYDTLSKSLLLQIMLFNRKRVGESERLLLQDFHKRQNIQKDSELYNSLSNTEKIIANSFTRVEIRGKKGRPVPILIRHNMAKKLEFLLSLRKKSATSEKNKYLFARGSEYYNAGRALREAAWECGASRPELITGTLLRKEIASTSQALNFTNTDMKNLADYMGHHGDVHDIFYKMPSDVIHLAKISQLLIAIDEGRVSEFYGKSLNEINVDIDVGEQAQETQEQQEQELNDSNEIRSSPAHSVVLPTTSSLMDSESQTLQSVEMPTTSSLSSVVHSKSPTTNLKSASRSLKQEKVRVSPKKIPDGRKTWTTPERHKVRKLFADNINEGRMPTRPECKQAIQTCPELKRRTVTQLKTWIYYEHKRNERKKQKIIQ